MAGSLGRRELLAGLGAALVACSGRQAEPRTTTVLGRRCDLWSWFDLPADDPRSKELSALAWDVREGALFAVQDKSPSIVKLIPDRELRRWTLGETITIDLGGAPVDLEGLVILPDGFLVASEKGPRVIEVDRRGRYRRDVTVPQRFHEARHNQSLESLTASPSGRYLFMTSEAALANDGPNATAAAGTRVRILRLERHGTDDSPVSEHVYETDPTPYEGSDWGISDMCAVADDELLVLERGWAEGHGNTARIYRAALQPNASCLGAADISKLPVLAKSLWVDFARLRASGLPAPKQPQPAPLLDNYEGISLGPRLADGRATLLVVSDDNGHADQYARILVLACA